MGLFTRFRTPSGPSSSGRPTTPGPSSHHNSDPPSRQSTSLGRQTSHFDYDEATAPTPRPKEKEKGIFGWKGKSKADVGGRPYEDQRSPPRPDGGPSTSTSVPGISDRRTNGGEKRITAIFTPHPHSQPSEAGPSTPSKSEMNGTPISPISPRSDRTVHPSTAERAHRPLSNEFVKDGGVLGRMTFEKDKPRARSPSKKLRKRDVPSWLASSGSEEDGDMSLGERMENGIGLDSMGHPPIGSFYAQSPSESLIHESPQQSRFPPVPARRSSIVPLRPDTGDADDGSAISDGEDEVESDTGGKKGSFWMNKVRRTSKAGEVELRAASGSRVCQKLVTTGCLRRLISLSHHHLPLEKLLLYRVTDTSPQKHLRLGKTHYLLLHLLNPLDLPHPLDPHQRMNTLYLQSLPA